jgi:hypothetical protein
VDRPKGRHLRLHRQDGRARLGALAPQVLRLALNNKPGCGGNSPLVGYRLDGLGIYGSYENGRQRISADLDGCNGRANLIDWDGRKVSMYHYVATVDFPYTFGCMRGT